MPPPVAQRTRLFDQRMREILRLAPTQQREAMQRLRHEFGLPDAYESLIERSGRGAGAVEALLARMRADLPRAAALDRPHKPLSLRGMLDRVAPRAQDGMAINAVRPPPPVDRAALIERAKKAPVQQRVQIGSTCGLYALGMVMDSWHAKDPRNAAPLVADADLTGRGKHYNFEPTTSERILDYAKQAGFTSAGEMFTARHLAATATHFGYTASLHERATLADLYRVLDAGHPAIVAFDVDYNGNPGAFGGERAHYAVIQGYFDHAGERYLVARHGWGIEKDHVWRAADFDRSWKALRTTTFYGTPGDGSIPGKPGLKEPQLLNLPSAGSGRADISVALATKIVEVVPPGEKPVGGEIVAAPH